MGNTRGSDVTDSVLPASITLTTDHVTADDVGPLVAALHAACVAFERRAFLPVRGEEQHPSGVLLLAASGPPLSLARLIAPATAPAGVTLALAAALGVEARVVPATLQLKADGVFVSVRGRDTLDITRALGALPVQLARLVCSAFLSAEYARDADLRQIPRALADHLCELLCYAA